MKPDPHAELAAIREDIRYLADRATQSTDLAALKRLQTSLTRWIHANMEQEQP